MTVIDKTGAKASDRACLSEGPEAAQEMVFEGEIAEALKEMEAAAEGADRPGGDPVGALADRAAKAAMAVAGAMFRETAEDLWRLRRQIQSGEMTGAGEVSKAVQAVKSGAQMMIDERNRLEKLRKDSAGGVGCAVGTLDLDAAREEIGRRLACLRRAGGS